jgi:hypothetical protein
VGIRFLTSNVSLFLHLGLAVCKYELTFGLKHLLPRLCFNGRCWDWILQREKFLLPVTILRMGRRLLLIPSHLCRYRQVVENRNDFTLNLLDSFRQSLPPTKD